MKDPAILLYKDKWLIATKGMKAYCRGWYLNLIIFQHELGDLPNDIEELALLCDVRISEYEHFKQVFEQVLKHKFEHNDNGRLENPFAKEIIKNREMFIDKRSNAGKISYLKKFIIKHITKKIDVIDYLLSSIEIDTLDLKNEQVLKQVLKQNFELYINGNVNVNVNGNSNVIENSVHHQIIKIHSDFYAQKNDGLKYRFQAASDGKAVKDIVEYLRTAKAPPKSPNEIIFAWEWILSNYDKWDSFHQKRLKLTQINSELPNIISIIKNGKSNSKNRTNGQSPDDAVAQSVRVAEKLRGDNDKRH